MAVCLRCCNSVQFTPFYGVPNYYLSGEMMLRHSLSKAGLSLPTTESPELTIGSHQYGQLLHLLAGIVELVTDVQRFVLFSPHRKREKTLQTQKCDFMLST